MFTRVLGRSEIEVSAMGLGCYAIGGPFWRAAGENRDRAAWGWGTVDDAESIQAIHAGMDAGINFFDTADSYGCGHSERVLGKAVSGRRGDVVIATKVGTEFDEEKKDYYEHNVTPEYIRRACEASLHRLGTDYIDLYQLHWGSYAGELGEIIETMEALVDEGKIRAYGWSTDNAERAGIFARGEHCTAIQHALSVLHDNAAMLALCDTENMASINRGPLTMGILTGKFTAESRFDKADIRSHLFDNERVQALMARANDLRDVLTAGGRTMAQGALGYLWARHKRTIPIPGFKTVKQVQENAAAMAFGPLSDEQMGQIDVILERTVTV